MLKITPTPINPFKNKNIIESLKDEVLEGFGYNDSKTKISKGINILLDGVKNVTASDVDAFESTATRINTETKSKTQTKAKHHTFKEYYDNSDTCLTSSRSSLFKRVYNGIYNIFESVITVIDDWKYQIKLSRQKKKEAISCGMENIQRALIREPILRNILDLKILTKLKANKTLSMAEINSAQAKINTAMAEIEQNRNIEKKKQADLEQLRYKFSNVLKQYIKLFDSGDLMPNISQFSNYRQLQYENLKEIFDNLIKNLCHQKVIKSKKGKYQNGAEYYVSANEANVLRNTVNLDLPEYNKNLSQQSFGRFSDLYIENINNTRTIINVLKQIEQKYLDSTNKKLEKIFDTKHHNSLFSNNDTDESIQFIDQYNLTNCIIKDFDDIMEKYIENTVGKALKEYSLQISQLKLKIQAKQFSEQNKEFNTMMLKRIDEALQNITNEYNNFCESFSAIKQSLTKICNNLKKQVQ